MFPVTESKKNEKKVNSCKIRTTTVNGATHTTHFSLTWREYRCGHSDWLTGWLSFSLQTRREEQEEGVEVEVCSSSSSSYSERRRKRKVLLFCKTTTHTQVSMTTYILSCWFLSFSRDSKKSGRRTRGRVLFEGNTLLVKRVKRVRRNLQHYFSTAVSFQLNSLNCFLIRY